MILNKQIRIQNYKPKLDWDIDVSVFKAIIPFRETNLTLERCDRKGWYIFGNKKIFVMIKDSKLVCRVGGGYKFLT